MRDRKFFMITGTVIAIAIALSLYYLRGIYVGMNEENTSYTLGNYAEIFSRSIDFNGQPVNRDLTLSEYNRKGKLVKEGLKLGEVLGEKGCIAFLSTNNCRGCVKNEISILKKLGTQDKMFFIYDSPVHEFSGMENSAAKVYYEFNEGELLSGLEKMQELPILFYIENGIVVASCVVSIYSPMITKEFHNFLKKRLNDD